MSAWQSVVDPEGREFLIGPTGSAYEVSDKHYEGDDLVLVCRGADDGTKNIEIVLKGERNISKGGADAS